ncbi:DUF1642 domain-containing protein [Companilactobacillus nodensis]|uniref:Uncharacterized protein n=1 Tax=Companilactobacillus nodensis DSM 19682 = JCM 14932 = NBRC 107160 TaxID=1423775 RepID=A0A0R1K9A9_9LACO|nr:DUF1642 domain-containing protein [Companilactobacillus nodensis]KRK80255.1 hypothetical protein FD03_GL002577 [Companilactobacillus nodensis DSM 19682 = JCM 14932 = NBRC 107160]
MRILKGWTKDERKELEEAKDGGFYSSIDLINGIVGGDDDCTSLANKCMNGDSEEDNQLIRDIADYYTGKAKFPEQKYYVQLIKNNDFNYLNRNKLNTLLTLDGYRLAQNYQTEFTEQEIKDIDPRYMAFAAPVEADDE